MSNLDIQIEGKTAFCPGEDICGRARWDLEDNPDCLEISLFWRTRGKGTEDIGLAQTIKFENPGINGVKDFRLTAPSGPYSFSGKLISIVWAVELATVKGKNSVRKEITISTTGREIVCTEQISETDDGAATGILPNIFNKFKHGRT